MRLNAIDGWWRDRPSDWPSEAHPIGYAWMVLDRGLDVMPHHRWSFIGRTGSRHARDFQHITWEVFPASYRPADDTDPAAQIQFALKYDGVNLEILHAWFATLAVDEIEALEAWVRSSPTSGYARRAWYLFELLTGRTLDLEDIAQPVAYAPLLDPDAYFVADGRRSRRHRVLDNLMGDRRFCATCRRTPALRAFAERQLAVRMARMLSEQDPDVLPRVVDYLYTKETRSSFEIERERPTSDRVRRFVAVLRQAQDWPSITTTDLIRLQNLIVTDPRNHDRDYRTVQNFVAKGYSREPDFISPRPRDLRDLMDGWLAMTARLAGSPVDAVVAAAAVSFCFVFLHPFEDGNGRVHRFLIHYVLARKQFSPSGMILPVSATMLGSLKEYETALERYSKPVMTRVRYEIDPEGDLEVLHDTSGFYRYPDLTAQAEALYGWVERTIEEEVPKELTFLVVYRDARRRLAEIVELPDRKADQLVARCIENRGRLSKNRRKRDFLGYSDAEIEAMEEAVRGAMQARGMETAS